MGLLYFPRFIFIKVVRVYGVLCTKLQLTLII